MRALRENVVTYKRAGFFKRLMNKLTMSLKETNPESLNAWFTVKNGNSYSEPIKDIIYKGTKGIFKTVITNTEINDEIPNEMIATGSNGKPYVQYIFNNGDGRIKFISLDKDKPTKEEEEIITKEFGKKKIQFIKVNEEVKFKDIDIRANDTYEKVSLELMKLLDPMKENRLLIMMFVMGMVGLGVLIMLGLMGLGQLQADSTNALNELLTTAVTNPGALAP